MSRSPHHLIALAGELEKEGQYNVAKLLRAAATSAVNRTSLESRVPRSPEAQADALREIADGLGDSHAAALVAPLRSAADTLGSGGVPLFVDTPDPFVCRICGFVSLGPIDGRCPTCGRWSTAAEPFKAIYWLRASSPPEALGTLAATPEAIGVILRSGDPNVPGPDGGWSAHQTLEHLHNAQGVFRGRIDQLIAGGEPQLASVMVWRMDGSSDETDDLFEAYRTLRTEIVDMLSGVEGQTWWNRGHHEEFGTVTLAEQASYFANHEPTHLAQLADAVG
jgi:predicted Zn-ribbon and HTH transcriptional regulator